LGLSIARWITTFHRGSISVESSPGKGSTFPVELPQFAGLAESSRPGLQILQP